LHADPEELAFIPNATTGVNIVARSLQLDPGDEILISDHEYGACRKTWEFICQKTGAVCRVQPIPIPLSSTTEILERIWAGVTARTRLIFFSHISSSTSLIFPVTSLCQRARQAGILTMIDGAHAPGQIPVHLGKIGPDFYAGNCHKWMLAPKGAGFLYTRRELQAQIEPLIVSWGWQPDPAYSTGSKYQDLLQWMGTDDPSAYLSVPASIQFMREYDWPTVQGDCRELRRGAARSISSLTGLPIPFPPDPKGGCQMISLPLPPAVDVGILKEQLYDLYKIEAPCFLFNGEPFIRISIQAYNTQEDIQVLIRALENLLPTRE
jgi:isopenicillin-N epimerase